MNANKSSAQKLLIIGGTSSLAPQLIQLAIADGFEIHATTRSLIHKEKDSCVTWWHLDLGITESVNEFILSIHGLTFTRIIYLIGESSGFGIHDFSEIQAREYLRTQLVSPILLISRLAIHLDMSAESNFVFVSSRSALHGSSDSLYGVAKAGIQNFIKSISKEDFPGISFVSVVTGLIINSRMQKNMGTFRTQSHLEKAKQAGGDLISLDEATRLIWAINPLVTLGKTGDVFMLGLDY